MRWLGQFFTPRTGWAIEDAAAGHQIAVLDMFNLVVGSTEKDHRPGDTSAWWNDQPAGLIQRPSGALRRCFCPMCGVLSGGRSHLEHTAPGFRSSLSGR